MSNILKGKPEIQINIHSFRDIYDLYYEPLCKFLLLYTKDASIVEDVVQEVFLTLWQNRSAVEINYIKTYLFQGAKNKMLNYLRDEKNRSVLLERWFEEQVHSGFSETEKYDTDKLLIIVEKAIESLPQKCKEIFMLNKVENLPYKKIAEIKNISPKTVENQIGIALKKIREFLSSNITLFLLKLFLFIS